MRCGMSIPGLLVIFFKYLLHGLFCFLFVSSVQYSFKYFDNLQCKVSTSAAQGYGRGECWEVIGDSTYSDCSFEKQADGLCSAWTFWLALQGSLS